VEKYSDAATVVLFSNTELYRNHLKASLLTSVLIIWQVRKLWRLPLGPWIKPRRQPWGFVHKYPTAGSKTASESRLVVDSWSPFVILGIRRWCGLPRLHHLDLLKNQTNSSERMARLVSHPGLDNNTNKKLFTSFELRSWRKLRCCHQTIVQNNLPAPRYIWQTRCEMKGYVFMSSCLPRNVKMVGR